MRTSTGLTITAVGAILLFAVNIPLPWLSLRIAGLIIMGTGLIGLRIPQEVSGWLRHNQDRVMDTFDPLPDPVQTPRVPLDALLDPAALEQAVPGRAVPGTAVLDPAAGTAAAPAAGADEVPR